MKLTLYMCMPEGEPMRQQWAAAANFTRDDNRYVVASMLDAGLDVPDHVEDLGAVYVPEQKRWECPQCQRITTNPMCCNAPGDPVLRMLGMRAIQQRRTFSCGDACAYESAVWIEKYNEDAYCLSVAQGDDDYHGVFVTPRGVVDPVARWMGSRGGPPPPARPRIENESRCEIHGGRVVCDGGPDMCCIGDDGLWHCPAVPQIHGRPERVVGVAENSHGARWARTKHGALAPVCRRVR